MGWLLVTDRLVWVFLKRMISSRAYKVHPLILMSHLLHTGFSCFMWCLLVFMCVWIHDSWWWVIWVQEQVIWSLKCIVALGCSVRTPCWTCLPGWCLSSWTNMSLAPLPSLWPQAPSSISIRTCGPISSSPCPLWRSTPWSRMYGIRLEGWGSLPSHLICPAVCIHLLCYMWYLNRGRFAFDCF